MASQQFERIWTAEIIRQYESHQGPLADTQANQQVAPIQQHQERLLKRAELLAASYGFAAQQHWVNMCIKATIAILTTLAVLSGITLATQLSPQIPGTISLIEALLLLVVVNLVFILFWLLTLLPSRHAGGIAQWLFKFAQQHIQHPQRLLALQSYGSTLARHHLIKPSFAMLSHWLWTVLLLTALVTLLLRFIAFDYQFVWQTTLLSEQQIQTTLAAFHTIPEWLGLAPPVVIPPSSQLIESDLLQRNTALWLLSCVILYALLPRLLLLLGCMLYRHREASSLAVNWSLPGFTELQQEWQRGDLLEVDAAPSHITVPGSPSLNTPQLETPCPTQPALSQIIVTLDWPESAHQKLLEQDINIPVYPANHQQQRATILTALGRTNKPLPALLLINSALSPDRGALRFIQTLTPHSKLTVGLALASTQSRLELWQEYLNTHLPEEVCVLSAARPYSGDTQNLETSGMELISQWTT